MKNISANIFLFAEGGLSNDDVRVVTGTVFQEIFKEGVGFKTGDIVKEKLGALPP